MTRRLGSAREGTYRSCMAGATIWLTGVTRQLPRFCYLGPGKSHTWSLKGRYRFYSLSSLLRYRRLTVLVTKNSNCPAVVKSSVIAQSIFWSSTVTQPRVSRSIPTRIEAKHSDEQDLSLSPCCYDALLLPDSTLLNSIGSRPDSSSRPRVTNRCPRLGIPQQD